MQAYSTHDTDEHVTGTRSGTLYIGYTGWPKKVSHYQMINKITLKPISEIRFIRQIKE